MTGQVQVESISSLGANPRFFLQNADGDTLKSYTAATDGWEELSVTADYSDGGFVFGGQNASGKMRIADLRIYASDGTLLYRLSTIRFLNRFLRRRTLPAPKGTGCLRKTTRVPNSA